MNYNQKAGRIYRAFYFLRTGYKLYLAFPLTLTNTLVIIYYFLIRGRIFIWFTQHKFLAFSAVGLGVVLPLASFLGWLHLKRLPGYAAEADLIVESNPYYYKLAPGIQREVLALSWQAFALVNKLLLKKEGLLAEEEECIVNKLIEQSQQLKRGESAQNK